MLTINCREWEESIAESCENQETVAEQVDLDYLIAQENK